MSDMDGDQMGNVFSNGITNESLVSICIPTFRTNPSPMIERLALMREANLCSIFVFDDGSNDEGLSQSLRNCLLNYPGPACLISSSTNVGRSAARNRLQSSSMTDWIIFLDADMLPDHESFLLNYLVAISNLKTPTLISGGFSLRQVEITAETRLHAAQSNRSECVSAIDRAKEPGRYVFTSNILVHKAILAEVPFDSDFKGWGWEDVDWGLRVAEKFQVLHLENTATHLGLDPDQVLLHKYANSGENFAKLVSKSGDKIKATLLYRFSFMLSVVPFRRTIGTTSRVLAEQKWLPITFRLFFLKVFRSATYAEFL